MLRVTVVELPAVWDDRLGVLALLDDELARGPSTDLVLLPEAAFTGYVSPRGSFDLRRFAEPLDGPTIGAVSELARKHRTSIVAPLVLREGAACFNAMAVVDERGATVAVYRKRHPWFPERWATAGTTEPPMFEVQGVRVTMGICFDVHFLADDATDALRGSDLLLFPSAWVDEEDTKIPTLARLARRFEISIANANWAPGVVQLPGQGDSCILDPEGRIVSAVRAGETRADAVVERRR
ncbi:5-aminopentanamidase [Labilithrix luteola]|uniref:5-aminopentanamidase n=1 Tax=Labilithrix luteola TaxID=1391654 RepID=A0A0K1QGD9_9BACT|nr:carbon-nitrogen hydrolase family protein [Labilithrix luteola]AKV04505.1 5-aminopentanamidase [Labilithrix luteola]